MLYVYVYQIPLEELLGKFMNKANTLIWISKQLKKSTVEEIYSFTEFGWQVNKKVITEVISKKYLGKTIIIRSSAVVEDTLNISNAGRFKSVTGVDSGDHYSIARAIDEVVRSYQDKNASDPDNLVLVQNQTMDVASSGVILTRSYSGAPYYVVNYVDGSDTAAVTSGSLSRSTMLLKRKIMRVPKNLEKLIEAVKEIESLHMASEALDIEYAVKNDGTIVTFQVRPLVTAEKHNNNIDLEVIKRVDSLKKQFTEHSKRKSHLAGDVTYFGDMPDWNPAEIIGSSPHPLAVSLYDYVITSEIWHKARASQGYCDVNPAKLVILFGNKPYVDVRSSFNSLIPRSISPILQEKLVSYYLDKLRSNPELQDKVEFEILFTCYDLSFPKRSKELLEYGLAKKEVNTLKSKLLALTNSLFDETSIELDILQNEALELERKKLSILPKDPKVSDLASIAIQLLDNCRDNGTFQFSRLARQAFISSTILRSLVDEKILSEELYQNFLESIHTIVSDFTDDIGLFHRDKLSKTDLRDKYGHLRPGTYNIEIDRYDKNDNYLLIKSEPPNTFTSVRKDFQFSKKIHGDISNALMTNGLLLKSQDFFKFVRSSLEAREYSKFLFTKSLSDAIELIASAGARLGFSRMELAYLDLEAIKDARNKDDTTIKKSWARLIEANKSNYDLNNYLYLPQILFSSSDFEIVQSYTSQPNYITTKKVDGRVVILHKNNSTDIRNKIVVVESADPGYEWIFAQNPAALITKYGGPASHMAIRCSELGLPAIIGSGEILYETVLRSKYIMIDCGMQKIVPFREEFR